MNFWIIHVNQGMCLKQSIVDQLQMDGHPSFIGVES